MLETMSRGLHPHGPRQGCPGERRSSVAHGLRAALTPIVTAAGLDLGGLLGGAIITEQVFNFTGLGWNSDPGDHRTSTCRSSSASSLVASFFIVIANLVVDVLYGVIDPRVRLS